METENILACILCRQPRTSDVLDSENVCYECSFATDDKCVVCQKPAYSTFIPDCDHILCRIHYDQYYNNDNIDTICPICNDNNSDSRQNSNFTRRPTFDRIMLRQLFNRIYDISHSNNNNINSSLSTNNDDNIDNNDIVTKDDHFLDDEDLKNYKEHNELDPESDKLVRCPVCLSSLYEDIVLPNCGHFLCKSCYNRVDENKCPTCREYMTLCKKILVDNQMKLLYDTKVKCQDCNGLEMTFKEFREHEKSFRIVPVTCKLCDNKVKNILLEKHMKICGEESTTCSQCKIILCKKDLAYHINEICDKTKIKCKCDKEFMREFSEKHQLICGLNNNICCECKSEFKNSHLELHLDMCPEAYVLCKYSFGLNCTYQEKRKNMYQHEIQHIQKIPDKIEICNSDSEIKIDQKSISKIFYKNYHKLLDDDNLIKETLKGIIDYKLEYKLGSFWDVLNNKGHWCVARIINIINHKKNNLLYVKFRDFDSEYNELINTNEKRFVPFGTISKYNLYPGKTILAKFDSCYYPSTIVSLSSKELTVYRNLDFEETVIPKTILTSKYKVLEHIESIKVGDILLVSYYDRFVPGKICELDKDNVKFVLLISSDNVYKTSDDLHIISYKNVCDFTKARPLYYI